MRPLLEVHFNISCRSLHFVTVDFARGLLAKERRVLYNPPAMSWIEKIQEENRREESEASERRRQEHEALIAEGNKRGLEQQREEERIRLKLQEMIRELNILELIKDVQRELMPGSILAEDTRFALLSPSNDVPVIGGDRLGYALTKISEKHGKYVWKGGNMQFTRSRSGESYESYVSPYSAEQLTRKALILKGGAVYSHSSEGFKLYIGRHSKERRYDYNDTRKRKLFQPQEILMTEHNYQERVITASISEIPDIASDPFSIDEPSGIRVILIDPSDAEGFKRGLVELATDKYVFRANQRS